MLILIGGGVRSGKSAFALALARGLGARRVYVATAEARDEEMSGRIARHVRERGSDYRTIEAPLDVVEALSGIGDADVVVLDCLTLWLSNLLLREDSEEAILAQVDRLIATLAEKSFHAVLVTNVVGMGIVPEHPLGRAFRDVAGRAHQALARAADQVYFGLLGLMLRLRPAPVAAVIPQGDGR
jgi:adenosylcobinamide kinase/adenosylcobinamide-phosphate guanylyltransferase